MKLSLKELGRQAVGRAMGMGGDGTGEERGEAGQGGCGQGQRPPRLRIQAPWAPCAMEFQDVTHPGLGG